MGGFYGRLEQALGTVVSLVSERVMRGGGDFREEILREGHCCTGFSIEGRHGVNPDETRSLSTFIYHNQLVRMLSKSR